MVGIVIVSHSRKLAEGVMELAEQMGQGQCSLAIAGGIDDDEHPHGTDAVKVMEAIEQVYDDSGVLIIMDMGSALLSTEAALDLIDPDMVEKVALCSAPIVEGTIAATVAASVGLPLTEVLQEACAALDTKKEQLGERKPGEELPAGELEQSSSAVQPEDNMQCEHQAFWVLQNPHGLHARPAAALVTALAKFDAKVSLHCEDKCANARSLNSIATLGARYQDLIQLTAAGPEARQAVEAFKALAAKHFGEDISQPSLKSELKVTGSDTELAENVISALPVSEGIVFGRVKRYIPQLPEAVPERAHKGESAEWQLFSDAVKQTQEQLAKFEKRSGTEHCDIFRAHQLMLCDPELQDRVWEIIITGATAEQAWSQAVTQLEDQYRSSESEYMRQRAVDIVDVGHRLLSNLIGRKLPTLEVSSPVILVAQDLTPSDTAGLDPEKVLGICLNEGSRTSHSAILARSLGIPAIVRADGCLEKNLDGQQVVLDGFNGQLWLNPDSQVTANLEMRRAEWLDRIAREQAAALDAAETIDGFCPDVMANINKPEDVKTLLEHGAQGVGLLRTEFLFLDREALPDEEEQYRTYCEIASQLNNFPLVIRTLDIGGDKSLPYLPQQKEANPFLGCRGIRFCLTQPDLLKTQLRAILRAAEQYSNIQVMFPMIATVDELIQAKDILHQCQIQLNRPAPKLPAGIMVEVPAAVLNAAELAREADFFSIGTNDLTQYVMAADRGNPSVAELADYRQPAVLKAISGTCKAAQAAGIPVGMCGEMAADTELTSLLLGMGVTKLSASPIAIPGIKASIRKTDMAVAKAMARSY